MTKHEKGLGRAKRLCVALSFLVIFYNQDTLSSEKFGLHDSHMIIHMLMDDLQEAI